MYTVAIRKNETGEVRKYQRESEWSDHTHFWWRRDGGNLGCDCNRELEWLRAGQPLGDETIDDVEPECGESRYDIMYIELPDGTQIDGKEFN